MVLILVSLPRLFKFYTIDFLRPLTYGFIYITILSSTSAETVIGFQCM